MKIGIDASRAFLKNRTGIEEYSYQVIKHLTNSLHDEQVVLYIRKNQKSKIKNQKDNLNLKEGEMSIPDNWSVREINWLRFWTQIGLSLEMLFKPVDVLFVPAHTVPFIHPRNTVVVVHGLEYEFCPEAYSWWERFYMRLTIKKSCHWASRIISVSENTKKDLVDLYKVPAEKIQVVYEGYEKNFQFPIGNSQSITRDKISKYFLFIGRIEKRKNISKVVEAFEKFKEKTRLPYKLILAGRPGYGYESIKLKVESSKFKEDIIELGYIREEEKWELLKNAEAFIFATMYEGFGIPVLEAQSVGCPVIASDNSSIPEVANGSVLLVNPDDAGDICAKMDRLATDYAFRRDTASKGLENVRRFSWEKCAEKIAKEITR